MKSRELVLAVVANFTAAPVVPALELLLDLVDIPHRVELCGYDQVAQALLDGAGALAGSDVAVVLLRLADLGRRAHGAAPADPEAMRRGARELAAYVAGHTARAGAAPLLVCLCPEPQALLSDPAHAASVAEIEHTFAADVRAAGAICLTAGEILALYPVSAWDDPASDELGHIPYTGEMFAALGAVIARKARARVAEPHKVLALDCDNTLWTGVVGEDGPDGIVLDQGRCEVQRFALAQREAGMLLTLCSKNVPEDVDEVFRRRAMPLERRHLAAARVSWQPKSEGLRALAAELSLGLSSFVFADDSHVECAEVRAHCPEVLTIHLPQGSADAAALLSHVWAFDRWQVTAEDRARADLYQQNQERERERRAAPSMADFLAALELDIRVEPPAPADMPRVSQLTFRTNQFNFTTTRRTEAEIEKSGLSCLKVQVRDRFGDHGLVGVVLHGVAGDALVVDTFLLSCRVLQRGVEHRMLARLGEIARERGLAAVVAAVRFSAKNQPAQQFLRAVGERWLAPTEGGFEVRLPADEAAALRFDPDGAAAAESERRPAPVAAPVAPASAPPAGGDRPGTAGILEIIARDLGTAAAIHARVLAASGSARPARATPAAPPRTEDERAVLSICEQALGIAPIGVTDDLFLDLGADSFAAVRIAAGLRETLGRSAEVVTVQQARTVERLAVVTAARVGAAASGPSAPIHALRRHGKKRPLFLGRPATRTGGALSYVALARALDPERPVYVFQNRPMLDGTEPYPSVEAMAVEYLRAMREVQPHGPYLLGGWCLGGKTVFEMANRLVAAGDRVERVILFDTPPPLSLRARARFLGQRALYRAELRAFSRHPWLSRALPWVRVARAPSLLQRFGVLAYHAADDDEVELVTYAFPGKFDAAALAAMAPEARWQHVYEVLAAPGEHGGDGASAAEVRRGYRYFAWDHRLDALYDPKWVYEGLVSMLDVVGGEGYPDRWRPLLARAPEVVEIAARGNASAPDAHSALMSEENVKLMAPVLAAWLSGD